MADVSSYPGKIQNGRGRIQKQVISDPLSDKTRKVRRNLLILSGTSLMVTVGVKFVFIRDEGFNPDYIQGAFSLILLYLMTSFFLYLRDDLRKYYIQGQVTLWNSKSDFLLEIRNSLHAIEQHLSKLNNGVDRANIPVWTNKVNDSLSVVDESQISMTELDDYYNKTLSQQSKILWAFDIIIPFIIGIFSFYKVSCGIPPLFKAIF